MSTTYPSKFDRRARPRFEIRVPVTLIVEDRVVSAFTRDLSEAGVFFYVASEDCPGISKVFEFVIEFPADVTLCDTCRILCHGRILRITQERCQEAGVAAMVLSYAFP